MASQVALVVKILPANVGDVRDADSINPLQHYCLENPMDRGAWGVTVHGVTESDTTEAT